MSEPTPDPAQPSNTRRFSRRALFGATGAGVVVAAAGGVTAARLADDDSSTSNVVAFRGTRQAGIVTEAQDRLHFASFDVITD